MKYRSCLFWCAFQFVLLVAIHEWIFGKPSGYAVGFFGVVCVVQLLWAILTGLDKLDQKAGPINKT